MSSRRRVHASAPMPSAGRYRWIAIVLVVLTLAILAVWIGIELSDWPPPPHRGG